jgi:hypothetical protein
LHLSNISFACVWDCHLKSLCHVADASPGRG